MEKKEDASKKAKVKAILEELVEVLSEYIVVTPQHPVDQETYIDGDAEVREIEKATNKLMQVVS
jgi:hypothetical protein